MAKITVYTRQGNERTIVKIVDDVDEDTNLQELAQKAIESINRPDLRSIVWISDGRHEYKAFFTEED